MGTVLGEKKSSTGLQSRPTFFLIAFLYINASGCGDDVSSRNLHVKYPNNLNAVSGRLLAEDASDELRGITTSDNGRTKVASYPLRRRNEWHRLSRNQLEAIKPYAFMVPTESIEIGQNAVPAQQDNWSCGLNSAARFSAMLGHPVEDYPAFHDNGPNYGGFLLIPKIGANAGGLQNYLREQKSLSHFSVAQRCSRAFHTQWEIMVRSLELGRPALALVMNAGDDLHWVNIIARDNRSGDWYYLDTDQKIYQLHGGDDELKNWMNVGNCWAQKMTFVERFNTVTATEDK